MKRWQYERLVEVVRPDAERCAPARQRHTSGWGRALASAAQRRRLRVVGPPAGAPGRTA